LAIAAAKSHGGVEVWKAGPTETAQSPLVFTDPARLEAGPEFPGLVIDPRRIWEV
jgi:hypothetical protein